EESLKNITYLVIAYRPRLEGAFAKIEHWIDQQKGDSYWRVVSSENVTSLFGTTENTRIVDPENASHIFEWLLAETFDARGCHIVYEYAPENSDNVPAALSEMNRIQTANKYIKRIAYGNSEPFQEGQTSAETWRCEVVFDYGEYTIDPTNSTPYTPVQPWAKRSDSFSTYQAGFEIRTHRLCHHVLMFHRFEELGPDPILVHATRFHYQTSPVVSLLQAVESIGYRYENGRYQTRSLPLLEFKYTPFQPEGQSFVPLQEDNGLLLPGLNRLPDYQLVDLYGEGIPGILYNDGRTTLYLAPEGIQDNQGAVQNVRYAPPQAPFTLPIHGNRQAMNLQLMDLTGNGQLDLLVSTPASTGYYEANADYTWNAFHLLPSFPTDFYNSDHYLMDMTGDGLADILVLEDEQVRIYPSLGEGGFGPSLIRSREQDIPLPRKGAANEVLQFADLFGSGMLHLVRITNGQVECWPNLGYGRFGAPVFLDNAPHFDADLDASRLFLADLDGSGTADIIYVHPDHVEIFFNQSGNAFSDPLSLPLPGSWDRINQIEFADVAGNGTTCLLLSENHPEPRHWCYDFSQGQKPYLLNEINNNLGAQSTITYCSSTKYYLADKKQGTPWIVSLPFPVQVVAKTETVDLISQARLVSTYTYHHGYYDGIEREFRGFGLVERLDAEKLLADTKPTDVPPVLTRTWYHTGAWRQDGLLSQQYRHEYYQQDSNAHHLPDSVFDQTTADADAWREAFRALKGLVLREEVYSPTAPASMSEQQQDAPYTLSETNYRIQLLQPRGQNNYGVYFVHPQETLTYDYERDPNDPRMQHTFILKVDVYGNVLRSCAVTYGRRQSPGVELPEQLSLQVISDENSFINQTVGGIYLLGAPLEQKTYEIDGPSLSPGQLYFTFEEIATYIDGVLSTTSARLLSWQRHYYWSPTQKQAYPLGQISSQALLYRTEEAVIASTQIEQVFADVLTKDDLDTLLSGEGGYQQDPDTTYWWNPGLSQSYLDAPQFFLPAATTDPYGHTTTYAYDPHNMLPVQVTDALNNQVTAQAIDYQILSPQQMRDINGNISEVLFDPLGMVVVTSQYGTENGQAVGFMQLKDYQQQLAPGMDDIIAHPQTYLQGASSYFYYDLFSWVNLQVPAHAVGLVATSYPASGSSPIQMTIVYSDGLGREQQSVMKVEPGEAHIINSDGSVTVATTADRWLASGRTVYNNKGNPVKQYEPYYISTHQYVDTPQLNTFGVSPTLFYDPLGRLIRVDTAKGFFTRVEFTPWMQTHYDENDTIKDADYYKNNIDNQTVDFQAERQALQKASLFYNTPTEQVLDNLGRAILTVQKLEGLVAATAFITIGLTPAQSQALWQELQIGGWLDPRGALTFTFQPDLPGFSLSLSTSFAAYEQQIIATLKEIQATGTLLQTHYKWDVQGHQLANADPRLSASGKENFRMIYTMTGQALKTVSADVGTHWQLQNVMGNPIYARDARNVETRLHYDALHRPIVVHVKGGDSAVPLDQVVEKMIYGDSLDESGQLIVSNPEKGNLRGQLSVHYDQAGVVMSSAYNILGLPLTVSRQLRQDYKQEANWNDGSPATLNTLLQSTIYAETYQYDALGRVTAAANADGKVFEPIYHLSGRLNQVQVLPQAGAQAEMYVQSIDYDARGQRQSIAYGNGVTTRYAYEPTIFRLIHILTTRSSDAKKLQDLTYTYDPVGNITHITDGAQEPVFNANQQSIQNPTTLTMPCIA
ncbi:MAG TPA: SpvB/TcaC N-terminal domain-containing protein, partial [Ktedonobacteraceae bacterium]|nr:SpvB/TcaC N-terminal domain-containing protein [Ktedonobacteraceae bacterium]